MTDILKVIKGRDPNEKEFHQAVEEVVDSVKPVLDRNPIATGIIRGAVSPAASRGLDSPHEIGFHHNPLL